MPKLLVRIVSLLLLPCLLADPARAFIPAQSNQHSSIQSANNRALFESNAMVPLTFIAGRVSRAISGRIGHFVSSRLPERKPLGNQPIALDEGKPRQAIIFQRDPASLKTIWLAILNTLIPGRKSWRKAAIQIFNELDGLNRANSPDQLDIARTILANHLREIKRSGRMWNTITTVDYWQDVFAKAGQPNLLRVAQPLVERLLEAGLAPYNRGESLSAATFAELALGTLGQANLGRGQFAPAQPVNEQEQVKRFFDQFADRVRRAKGASQVDAEVAFIEREVRNALDFKNLTSHSAAQFLTRLHNEVLVPMGFTVEQSPLGLSDERAFVVYEIIRNVEAPTDQGPVTVRYLRQVTKFKDGMLRGNPGWSSLYSDDVVVFDQALGQLEEHEILPTISGQLAFRPAPGSPNPRRIERLARLHQNFLRKAFPDGDRRVREVMGKSTQAHEVEHERRRRMIGLEEGDTFHSGIEEELAELKSMDEGPDYVIAHLIQLAAGDVPYAWTILKRLVRAAGEEPAKERGGLMSMLKGLGRSAPADNNDDILSALENRLLQMDAPTKIRLAQMAYAEVEKEWRVAYADKLNGGRSAKRRGIDLQTNPGSVLAAVGLVLGNMWVLGIGAVIMVMPFLISVIKNFRNPSNRRPSSPPFLGPMKVLAAFAGAA